MTRHKRGTMLAHDGVKPCCKCDRILPIEQFPKCSANADGLHAYCKECKSAAGKDWHRSVAAERTWYFRLKRYGITKQDFERLWSDQEGLCALCRKPLRVDGTVVDHSHHSGRVRGLLCIGCNTALGHIETMMDRLPLILSYIREEEAPPCAITSPV